MKDGIEAQELWTVDDEFAGTSPPREIVVPALELDGETLRGYVADVGSSERNDSGGEEEVQQDCCEGSQEYGEEVPDGEEAKGGKRLLEQGLGARNRHVGLLFLIELQRRRDMEMMLTSIGHDSSLLGLHTFLSRIQLKPQGLPNHDVHVS